MNFRVVFFSCVGIVPLFSLIHRLPGDVETVFFQTPVKMGIPLLFFGQNISDLTVTTFLNPISLEYYLVFYGIYP